MTIFTLLTLLKSPKYQTSNEKPCSIIVRQKMLTPTSSDSLMSHVDYFRTTESFSLVPVNTWRQAHLTIVYHRNASINNKH